MRPDQRQFQEDTRADEEAVARVMERLGHGGQALDMKAVLSFLPEPPAYSAVRVRNRVLLGREKPRPFPWFAAGLASAAAILLVWRLTAIVGIEATEPPASMASLVGPAIEIEDSRALPVEPSPVLAVTLVDSGGLQILEPIPGLKIRFKGAGKLEGTAEAPHLEWFSGTVEIEVDPKSSLAVSVQTMEGRVQVIGTVFSVDRSALGTEVGVTRGRVQVECMDGSSHSLVSDAQPLVCLPISGAGMLGRSRALSGDPEAVLLAINRGEEMESSAAISAEFLALEVETLMALGRNTEALSTARLYLESGGPRELELIRMAANLALQEEGCAGALPYLERLAPTQADAAGYVEECKARTGTETSR